MTIQDSVTKLARWVAVGWLSVATPAFAGEDDTGEVGALGNQCVVAHTRAQKLRRDGRLLDARRQLLICGGSSCPRVIIADCMNWIDEVEQATPSMVFEIRHDQRDAADSRVVVDGKPVVDLAHALKLDPGRHRVTVTLDGLAPYEEEVILREGQRRRLFSHTFTSPDPTAAVEASAVVTERPFPKLVYPLVGLSVVGLGSFGILTFLADRRQRGLETSCSPACTDEQVKPVTRMYLAGDISLGVSAASLAAAAIYYWARPSIASPARDGQAVLLTPTLTPNGSWSLSASGEW